jgi:hypothetical protein
VELYTLTKFGHIATLFFAVALAISGEIVVRRVAASRDVRAIRTTVARVAPVSGKLAGMLMMAGIALGVVTAIVGGLDLLRPWLVMSYLAVAAAFVIGATITDPWIERLGSTAEQSSEDAPSEELNRVIDDRRARYATVALMALIVLLVFLMVVKPLG